MVVAYFLEGSLFLMPCVVFSMAFVILIPFFAIGWVEALVSDYRYHHPTTRG